jgi:polysaccharide biosynthesis protein PslH
MGTPKVLWVTPEPPDRRQGGGSIRQSYLLEALAGATPVDVLLVCQGLDAQCARVVHDVEEFPEPAGPPRPSWIPWYVWTVWENEVLRMPSPVVDTREHCRILAPRLRARAPRYDLVHFEHDRLAPLGREPGPARRSITLHNLRSEQAAHRLADENTSAVGRWFARRARRVALDFERGVTNDFDTVFVTSQDDAAALPGSPVVVPNGVDLAGIRFEPLPSDRRIVFTGRLDWQPNVEGLKWFCRSVLPGVRARMSDVQLDIVGFKPGADVLALRGSGVAVYPDVPSTIPFLHRARVAVVPLHVGSGTRLKALEALAAGRPVVGTAIGLAGLDLESGRTGVVADDPDQMAAGLVSLLDSDDIATAMAQEGRRHVEERFDWHRIASAFAGRVLALAEGEGG